MHWLKLTRENYLKPTLEIARMLLGKVLVHHTAEGITSGVIVETEAYGGTEDDACHAFNMRRTRRTEAMFSLGGTSYVYLIYGMYYCFNVVTQAVDIPEAVLIRTLDPLEGLELMCHRRKRSPLKANDRYRLCNGPGKLCQAMGIGKEQNRRDLCESDLYISGMRDQSNYKIQTSPRVNVDYAQIAKAYPWRFYYADHPAVSKIKRR